MGLCRVCYGLGDIVGACGCFIMLLCVVGCFFYEGFVCCDVFGALFVYLWPCVRVVR